MDCFHSFCGACFSDWMKKSNECPNCRADVQAVKKNAQLNSLVEDFLDAHPDKKRSQEEMDEMDQKNKITLDKIDMKQI